MKHRALLLLRAVVARRAPGGRAWLRSLEGLEPIDVLLRRARLLNRTLALLQDASQYIKINTSYVFITKTSYSGSVPKL